MSRVSFRPPIWLRLVAWFALAVLTSLATVSVGYTWIFDAFLAVWMIFEFPRVTFLDDRGVWQWRAFGLGVKRIPWRGAWVEHEPPAMGMIPGEVRVLGANGTTLTFRGSPQDTARFVGELTQRGLRVAKA